MKKNEEFSLRLLLNAESVLTQSIDRAATVLGDVREAIYVLAELEEEATNYDIKEAFRQRSGVGLRQYGSVRGRTKKEKSK